METTGLYLLLLVLVFSGPAVDGKGRRCKKPRGYPGDLAKCSSKGKWERDESLEKIKDTVVENGEKLDELLQGEGVNKKDGSVVFGYWQQSPQPDAFVPYHVVTNEDDFICMFGNVSNYWIVDNFTTGDEASLYMVFKSRQKIKGFMLKNSHNCGNRNMGTQNFTISSTDSWMNETGGPQSRPPYDNWTWADRVAGQLPDPRPQQAVPVLNFELDAAIETQFLRFRIDSYWGVGGGLQYFSPYEN